MIFEYDDNKSRSNLAKHGIDFEEAQQLWNDPTLLVAEGKDVGGEQRMMCIGCINNKHWTAITHYRQGNIRIISVRRARKVEVEGYENKRRRTR